MPINQQEQMGRAGPITLSLRAEPGRARKLRPVEARQHNLDDFTTCKLVTAHTGTAVQLLQHHPRSKDGKNWQQRVMGSDNDFMMAN